MPSSMCSPATNHSRPRCRLYVVTAGILAAILMVPVPAAAAPEDHQAIRESLIRWAGARGYEGTALSGGTYRLKIRNSVAGNPCEGEAVILDHNPVIYALDPHEELQRAIAEKGSASWKDGGNPTFRGDIAVVTVGRYSCLRRAGTSTYNAYPGGKPQYQPAMVQRCGDGWSTGRVSLECPDLGIELAATWNGSRPDIQGLLEDFLSFYEGQHPPHHIEISYGPSSSRNPVSAGEGVQLLVKAKDTHGHVLRYRWTDLSGMGSFDDPTLRQPTWHAPQNNSQDVLACPVEVRVWCDHGAVDTGRFTQEVHPSPLAYGIPVVRRVRGAATVEIDGQRIPVTTGMMIKPGSRLRVGDNGMVMVERAPKYSVHFHRNTDVILRKIDQPLKKGFFKTVFWIMHGMMFGEASLDTEKGDGFEVEADHVVFGVHGTRFWIEHDRALGESMVRVEEGTMRVTCTRLDRPTRLVTAGESVRVGDQCFMDDSAVEDPPLADVSTRRLNCLAGAVPGRLAGQGGWYGDAAIRVEGALTSGLGSIIVNGLTHGSGRFVEVSHPLDLGKVDRVVLSFRALATSNEHGRSSANSGVGFNSSRSDKRSLLAWVAQQKTGWAFDARLGRGGDVQHVHKVVGGIDHPVELRIVLDRRHGKAWGEYDLGGGVWGRTPVRALAPEQVAMFDEINIFQDWRVKKRTGVQIGDLVVTMIAGTDRSTTQTAW